MKKTINPNNKFIIQISQLFTEYYQQMLSENIKKGLSAKKHVKKNKFAM